MQRFRILWGLLVVLSLTLLAACAGDLAPDPLAEEATNAAETSTRDAELTAGAPTDTPKPELPTETPTEAPLTELHLDDEKGDGVNCASREAVTGETPTYVDILNVLFAGDQDKAQIQIAFGPGLDLAELVADSNVLYTVGIGVLNPLNPISPDNPSANQYFSVGWLGKQQLFHTVSKFSDGEWATTQNSEAIAAQFDGASLWIDISREALPLEGRMHLGVSRDNRICDFVGLSPDGSEVTFKQDTVPDRLWIWGSYSGGDIIP